MQKENIFGKNDANIIKNYTDNSGTSAAYLAKYNLICFYSEKHTEKQTNIKTSSKKPFVFPVLVSVDVSAMKCVFDK